MHKDLAINAYKVNIIDNKIFKKNGRHEPANKKKPADQERSAGKLPAQTETVLELILETCLDTFYITINTVFKFTIRINSFDTHVDTGNRTPDQVGMD